LLVQTSIDLADFQHPPAPFAMVERQQLFVRPVKMKGNVRYLLIEPL